MFAKIINGVPSYPYNTRADYPNTSFPEGADYPGVDIYWVYPVAPTYDPVTHQSTESTPVFNAELSRWEQGWTIQPLTDEAVRATKYNPSQFMQEMFASVSFKSWIGNFPVIDQMAFFDACTNAKIDNNWAVVQAFYDGFKQVIAPSTELITEWNRVAERNGIPLTF